MSLIEEALRKQREENEKSSSISLAPPPIPAPAPSEPGELPPELPPAEEPARRPWALLAGIAVASILAILFIAWLLIFGLKLWQTKPERPPIAATPSTNIPHASPTTISPPQKETNAPSKPPTPPQATPTPPPAVTKPITPPPATPPTALPQAQEVPLKTPPPVTQPQPVTLAPKVTPIAPPSEKLELPVMWPKLTVSGIIGSSKSGRSAVILNGQMLCPGDTMEGVSVESIDKQRVKLKFNGEVKMLSVGSSTE